MEKCIKFLLERVVYPILLVLKRRKYIIPVDTRRDCIVRKNVLINILCTCADWICLILIIYGWSQKTVTYISLMTIAVYTFVDQYKIYKEQWKFIKSEKYICKIRQRENKYLKYYTPNLKYAFLAALAFFLMLILMWIDVLKYFSYASIFKYRLLILSIGVLLVWIKTKYYFLDMFDVVEFAHYSEID